MGPVKVSKLSSAVVNRPMKWSRQPLNLKSNNENFKWLNFFRRGQAQLGRRQSKKSKESRLQKKTIPIKLFRSSNGNQIGDQSAATIVDHGKNNKEPLNNIGQAKEGPGNANGAIGGRNENLSLASSKIHKKSQLLTKRVATGVPSTKSKNQVPLDPFPAPVLHHFIPLPLPPPLPLMPPQILHPAPHVYLDLVTFGHRYVPQTTEPTLNFLHRQIRPDDIPFLMSLWMKHNFMHPNVDPTFCWDLQNSFSKSAAFGMGRVLEVFVPNYCICGVLDPPRPVGCILSSPLNIMDFLTSVGRAGYPMSDSIFGTEWNTLKDLVRPRLPDLMRMFVKNYLVLFITMPMIDESWTNDTKAIDSAFEQLFCGELHVASCHGFSNLLVIAKDAREWSFGSRYGFREISCLRLNNKTTLSLMVRFGSTNSYFCPA